MNCTKCKVKIDINDKGIKFIRRRSQRDFYCVNCSKNIVATEYKGRKTKFKK